MANFRCRGTNPGPMRCDNEGRGPPGQVRQVYCPIHFHQRKSPTPPPAEEEEEEEENEMKRKRKRKRKKKIGTEEQEVYSPYFLRPRKRL